MSVLVNNSYVSKTFMKYIYPPNTLNKYTYKNYTTTNLGLMSDLNFLKTLY